MAIYAVGDVHGCLDALKRLLDQVHFDPVHDQLWQTGDLVNRGHQSLETLRFFHSLGKCTQCVLGNNDVSLIAAYYRIIDANSTLRSTLDAPDAESLIHWLKQQPFLFHSEPQQIIMVHAGLSPFWTLQEAQLRSKELSQALNVDEPQDWLRSIYGNEPRQFSLHHSSINQQRYALNCFTRMRYLNRAGEMDFDHKQHPDVTQQHTSSLVPWFHYPVESTRTQHILFGHWAALGYYRNHQVTALDTGCVWGGCLSAIQIDREERPLTQINC